MGVIGLGAIGGSIASRAVRSGVSSVIGYAASARDRSMAARAGAVPLKQPRRFCFKRSKRSRSELDFMLSGFANSRRPKKPGDSKKKRRKPKRRSAISRGCVSA